MTATRRDQHLNDVLTAMVEYARSGASLTFHSDRSDGVLSITFRLDEPAAYDQTLQHFIADSNNGVRSVAS